MPKVTYQGDGRCVFCMQRFADSDLTDEHVIPEAIHGASVIKNGSCFPCARFSNKSYENEALNNDLKVARLLLELKGKRGAAIPRHIRHLPAVYPGNSTMEDYGEPRMLDFPVGMYPKHFTLIRFPPPGILSGIDRGGAITEVGMRSFFIDGKGLSGVTVQQEIKNGPFAMMLAKIGYCFAVGERGLDGFDGDEIRELLRDEREDIYNFVGNSKDLEFVSQRHLHGLNFRQRGEWLTVLVNLFASFTGNVRKDQPYEIVVGKAR